MGGAAVLVLLVAVTVGFCSCADFPADPRAARGGCSCPPLFASPGLLGEEGSPGERFPSGGGTSAGLEPATGE